MEERTVIETYPGGVEIVEVAEDLEPRYRFEAPQHEPVEFRNPELARLYADVWFDVNSFREEKTGSRGVPPAVAMAGKDTLAAYLVTQSGMSVTWAARFMDLDENSIRTYISRVRRRAKERREELADEPGEQVLDDTADQQAAEPVDLDDLLQDWYPGRNAEERTERRASARAVLNYLREAGSATPDEIKSEVYPTHGVDNQTEDTWWRNTARGTLDEGKGALGIGVDAGLVELQKGPPHVYRWTGD